MRLTEDYTTDEETLPNRASHTVTLANEGALLCTRIALVCFYAVFGALYSGFAVLSGFVPIVAVLPIFLWILVHFTWRLTVIDYTVAAVAGTLTVTKKRKGLKPILLLECPMKTCTRPTPYVRGTLGDCTRRIDVRGRLASPSVYLLYTEDGTAVLFETNSHLLACLSRFCAADGDGDGKENL